MLKQFKKFWASGEKDAQMCIYDASWDTHYGFCSDVDDETSHKLARLPRVRSVKPDQDFGNERKDYSFLNVQRGGTMLFPLGNTKQWLVRMDKPGIGVVTKAQMVDYCAQVLSKVLGNEREAQMCIYHVSWESNFGFCCELDEECAHSLAGNDIQKSWRTLWRRVQQLLQKLRSFS